MKRAARYTAKKDTGLFQYNLPFEHDLTSLTRYFEQAIGMQVTLVLTDNSISMFSMKEQNGRVVLRLHRMFLRAGDDVLEELSRYVINPRGRTPLFWRFVKNNGDLVKKKGQRRINIRTRGRHHDLKAAFDRINTEYFDGTLKCSITWGSMSSRRWARERTLGSYCSDTDTVRISPLLDSKRVPRYYLDFVVYHEMLHARIDMDEAGGRRVMHSEEFRRQERAFKDYERAVAWEKK